MLLFFRAGGNAAPLSADAPETKYSVVLLPVDLARLPKRDKALYTLAILARDSAPRGINGERAPSFYARPQRIRLTGLEYAFA